jgi:RNA polymerase sigma factor (sigma-70 family)
MSLPSRTTTTTALLDALCASENGPQWTVFVARYEPILRAVACRLGLAAEDAADVAQQTLLEFVRDMRAGRYDRSRGRLRTWIVAIAEHRGRDLLRRIALRRGDASDGALATLPDRATLEAAWDDAERKGIAHEAWDTLRSTSSFDERTIRVFELVALHGVPPSAAASEFGMTEQHVYVVRHRVARRLRELVDEVTAAYQDGGTP